MPTSRLIACLALSLVVACDADSADPEPSAAPTPTPAPGSTTDPVPSDAPPAAAEPPTPAPAPSPEQPAAPVDDPVPTTATTLRRAERATMLYDAPRFSAAFRGKIARGETFAVGAGVEGDPECKAGWAKLGSAAFVCLARSRPVESPEPTALPRLGAGGLTPFWYAKRRGADHPAPKWRSRAALKRGAEPEGELAMDHDYAFVRRRWANGQRVLEDADRRVVKEADVRRFRPSTFEGRDLLAEPLPSEGMFAFAVAWPKGALLERPHPDAKAVVSVPFQSALVLRDARTRKRGTDFYPLADGSGWVEAKSVRRYIPAPTPEGVDADEVWVDVEVSQQTLVLMRGDTPEFITLMSSGTGRHPTPLGLYRLESKLALTDMRSKPGDDDAYHVEAVPWAMYFDGRFALHGAYWHNRFGNRVSHGCVNLAPKDAKRVFDALSPQLPAGWLSVYEHTEDLGSLVRVRKGTKPPPDRRRTPRRRNADD